MYLLTLFCLLNVVMANYAMNPNITQETLYASTQDDRRIITGQDKLGNVIDITVYESLENPKVLIEEAEFTFSSDQKYIIYNNTRFDKDGESFIIIKK